MPRRSQAQAELEHNPRGVDVNLRAGPQMLEYEAVADRIARDRPASLLDWGCGWGHISDLLQRRGLAVESFDYQGPGSPDRKVPLPKFPHLEAFVSSEPVRLPYEDGTFEAVLSCGVLEHVAEPEGSLDELRRVLRPGGTLYCYKLPNRASYIEWVARRAGLYYHGQDPYDRLYTKATARALLESHGYEILSLRRANMLPLTLTGRVADRLGRVVWLVNRALSRVPVLNLLATNIELVARVPAPDTQRRPAAPSS